MAPQKYATNIFETKKKDIKTKRLENWNRKRVLWDYQYRGNPETRNPGSIPTET